LRKFKTKICGLDTKRDPCVQGKIPRQKVNVVKGDQKSLKLCKTIKIFLSKFEEDAGLSLTFFAEGLF
jgi:hypothetical protein